MVKDEPWLLLIQVSFSSYNEHRSEVVDLKDMKENSECTWTDYYHSLVDKEDRET